MRVGVLFLILSLFICGLLFSLQKMRFFPFVDDRVRVACAGDSITFGSGIVDRARDCYPAQLQKKLGRGYVVKNFGLAGASALKKTHLPYQEHGVYQRVLNFKPEVIFLKLGTNDGARDHWGPLHKNFMADYSALVEGLLTLESKPKIYLCTPAPTFNGLKDVPNHTIRDEIIPRIGLVAEKFSLPVIDLYSPLLAHPEYFPDSMHPTKEGAGIMAGVIYEVVKNINKP